MLVHPQFSPVAIQLGPIAIHWYGLTYLAAFVSSLGNLLYLLALLNGGRRND